MSYNIPMIHFDSNETRAGFYLAAEEYIMGNIRPDEPVLMLWSVDPTVVIGANQIAKVECDLEYMKDENIELIRRPSGGGAIYTDREGLKFTIIMKYESGEDAKSFVQNWLAGPVLDTVAHFGADAVFGGRNDLLLAGKKFSGVSQYIRNGYVCSHGTLIFNTNLDCLERVLTVDQKKIETKAIASVRSRVTNITEHIEEKNLSKFREVLVDCYEKQMLLKGLAPLIRKEFTLNELKEIEIIVQEKYYNPEWTIGRDPAFTFRNKKRFPGGSIEVFLDVKGGVIRSAKIAGDFLALRPVTELEEGLLGVQHTKNELEVALKKLDITSILGSLTEEELLETLL